MITEQVRRLSAAIRAAGFKRGEFSARAEIIRERDRSTGRRYSVYGKATATFRGTANNLRARERADKIAAQGVVVEVFIIRGKFSFVAVREPKYLGTFEGRARYETPAVIERDLDAEIAESTRLLAAD